MRTRAHTHTQNCINTFTHATNTLYTAIWLGLNMNNLAWQTVYLLLHQTFPAVSATKWGHKTKTRNMWMKKQVWVWFPFHLNSVTQRPMTRLRIAKGIRYNRNNSVCPSYSLRHSHSWLMACSVDEWGPHCNFSVSDEFME